MSVRHGLLALLAEGPSYGYQLRTRLQGRTGGTWPLNIGQVYTTLSRLERDGLVEATGADGQATYTNWPDEAQSSIIKASATDLDPASFRPRKFTFQHTNTDSQHFLYRVSYTMFWYLNGQVDGKAVDVGPFAAFFGEETLEQQFHADGIDCGNAERVADGAVGG